MQLKSRTSEQFADVCVCLSLQPMDRLVEETLKYGLIPPVVMEFPGITAGGGYSGTSGESSSFKHGFFDRTLLVGQGPSIEALADC